MPSVFLEENSIAHMSIVINLLTYCSNPEETTKTKLKRNKMFRLEEESKKN